MPKLFLDELYAVVLDKACDRLDGRRWFRLDIRLSEPCWYLGIRSRQNTVLTHVDFLKKDVSDFNSPLFAEEQRD